MKVSGANNMLEMRKGQRRYILIGEEHSNWSSNNCEDKNSILITEFLHQLFTKDPEKQWDFYIETAHFGLYNYHMEDRSLYGKILNPKYIGYYFAKLTGKYATMEFVKEYFKTYGCFSNVECDIKNTRFHFGDVRTTDYCGFKYEEYDIMTHDIWRLTEDKMITEDRIDIHLNYLKKVVKCFEAKKIKKQLKKAYNSKDLLNYYEPIIKYVKEYILYYVKGIEKNKKEILDKFNKIKDKKDKKEEDEFTDYLFEITIDVDLVKKNKKLNDKLFQSLNPSDRALKSKNRKVWSDTGAFIIYSYTRSMGLMIMDMYTMGRSFREFESKKQDNVVILAGDAHILNYQVLLKHLGFKTIWKSKQLGKAKPSIFNKCSLIPDILEGETKIKRKTKKKLKKETKKKHKRKTKK